MIQGADAPPLAVVGCDFRVASSCWRSRLVLDGEKAKQIAFELKRNAAADGFADLNTCNRNEWIVSSSNPRWAGELLRTQMKTLLGTEGGWIEPYLMIGEEAVKHILRVVIGQESLVTGERQIAGQLFKALETARVRQTSSRTLNGLGAIAGRLVRVGIRRGCVGQSAKGVHSLAVAYLERCFTDCEKPQVAVVGLGSIGRRVLGLLEDNPRFAPVGCNRTVRDDSKGRIRPLAELRGLLSEVDAAIVCTGAQRAVLDAAEIPQRIAERRLIVIDIGIPEQVTRSPLPDNVEVAGLDELTAFHRDRESEDESADDETANTLVQRAMAEFDIFCNKAPLREVLDTIQRHNRLMVWEEIPRLVAEHFDYVPAESRSDLEQDLRRLVLSYTNEVFRTIKETSARQGENS